MPDETIKGRHSSGDINSLWEGRQDYTFSGRRLCLVHAVADQEAESRGP